VTSYTFQTVVNKFLSVIYVFLTDFGENLHIRSPLNDVERLQVL
jgi:hypothetical protein